MLGVQHPLFSKKIKSRFDTLLICILNTVFIRFSSNYLKFSANQMLVRYLMPPYFYNHSNIVHVTLMIGPTFKRTPEEKKICGAAHVDTIQMKAQVSEM